MLLITYIQLSLFGKTSWERFLQMTGWTLEPSYPPSRTPKFQCLLREDGETPEWCEGDGLIPLGGSWTPSIGENPLFRSVGGGCSSWRILQENVPQKYYLSPAVCSRILRLAAKAGCPPPAEIEYLLLKQGGRYPSCALPAPADAVNGKAGRSKRFPHVFRQKRRTLPNFACQCRSALRILV